MCDILSSKEIAPTPALDCRFARTCIYLSFKGLNMRHKLSVQEKYQRVHDELTKLMSKNTYVPEIPCLLHQQVCQELDTLKNSGGHKFQKICEVFSPPAWLKLPNTERAAHQLLSRPCYACVQHNVSVYKMFETSRGCVKAEASSSSTSDSEISLQTKNSPNDDLMLQLRELIKPSIEIPSHPTFPPPSAVMTPPDEAPEKISEQEANLLAALTALPSTTLDRMINMLSRPSTKQQTVKGETVVCRTSAESLYHQTSNPTPLNNQSNPSTSTSNRPLSFIRATRTDPCPACSCPNELRYQHTCKTYSQTPASMSHSISNTTSTCIARTIPRITISSEIQTSVSPPVPVSARVNSPPVVSTRQIIPTCLKVSSVKTNSSQPRLKLLDLSDVPENGLWIVKTSKSLFELSVGSVINTASIAEREKAPSKNHVTKLAQILGLKTRLVENQEILSGFRMFKNSANFDLNFASQIAKVTIHQLLEGGCADKKLSALCRVISNIIMQAFNLHRDTPPMTVAKIIMIQGSPLQHRDTINLTPANSAATISTSTISSTSGSATSRRRASRTASGGNSLQTSGDTISRKRRKVYSGTSTRSPKQKSSSSSSGASSANGSEFKDVITRLVGDLSQSTLDLLNTGENLSYNQVADLASSMTNNFVGRKFTSSLKTAVSDDIPAVTKKEAVENNQRLSNESTTSIDCEEIRKRLNNLIKSVETDKVLVRSIEQSAMYSKACRLGYDIGKLYRRVELLMNSVHISDSMLLTTALLATLHYLSSQQSCKDELSPEKIVRVISSNSNNRKFLSGLIASCTLPGNTVQFKETNGGDPEVILKSINDMYSRLSQTNGVNTPSIISKPRENRADVPVDSSVITVSDRNITNTVLNWDKSQTQRGAKSLQSHPNPDQFISNEDDDIAVAERLHFLVTEVARATEPELA